MKDEPHTNRLKRWLDKLKCDGYQLEYQLSHLENKQAIMSNNYDCTKRCDIYPLSYNDTVLGRLVVINSKKDVIKVLPNLIMYLYAAVMTYDFKILNSQKIEKTKNTFIASVSHELKTPLTSIINSTSTLNKTGKLDVDQRICLAQITDSTYELLRLINDIIDTTKLMNGYITLINEEFDADLMIKEAIDVATTEKNEYTRFKLRCDNIGIVLSDRMRVKQILINLLSNAFKYTDKGVVSLAIYVEDVPKTMIIDVMDTGCGIRKEDLDHIFEPFANINNSIKSTGLGLSIVKRLVEVLFGGSIIINSEIDKGTRIITNIPIQTKEYVPSEIIGNRRTRNVLVIHQSKDINNIRNILTKYKINYTITENLEIDGEFDVIILVELDENLIYSIMPILSVSADISEATLMSGITKKTVSRNKSMMTLRSKKKSGPSNYMPCIMIVDDNTGNRKSMEALLISMGYVDNTLAESGKEALKLLKINKNIHHKRSGNKIVSKSVYDMVFIDIFMPNLDGWETARAINEMFANNKLAPRLIGISAADSSNHNFADYGMSHFINKPINKDKLKKTITSCL
jgi:CheY-like chemotaxis protein/nitrogen-specific signal transduction histidine kinase